MSERRERESKHLYEENAYVLDYLPFGKPGTRGKYRAGAVVQLIGESYFTLLEANVKPGVTLKPLDRVYVGKESRKEIAYILGRIGYDELTANARMELENVVEKIVQKREKWFVNFFNTAQPITPRMHTLELIPGIGKKYMWDILNRKSSNSYLYAVNCCGVAQLKIFIVSFLGWWAYVPSRRGEEASEILQDHSEEAFGAKFPRG